MYNSFYRLNPDDTSDLLQFANTYSDDFSKSYNKIIYDFDQFIYLLDTYKILEDCSKDFITFTTNSQEDFWKVNKLLFNYVNAVYIFKEFSNNYSQENELKTIIDNYYEKDKWFRFICDYRNAVIHQFGIIKDMRKKEFYLNIDELAKVLKESSKNRKNDKNKIAFANKLTSKFYDYSVIFNGNHFLNLKDVVKNVNHEIDELNDKLVYKAYEKYIRPNLLKLLKYSYIENDKYFYTFIINQNDKMDFFEPNFNLEYFIFSTILNTTKHKKIIENTMSLLRDNKYTYFISYNSSIDKLTQQ